MHENTVVTREVWEGLRKRLYELPSVAVGKLTYRGRHTNTGWYQWSSTIWGLIELPPYTPPNTSNQT